ncbi:EpsG family protein [Flavobacterium sp. ALJ2]|uniref:EpsG family protein n=1 Tax=Flavobacterium sp. ALJ2 TaxID=2786960 RepID=UPI00189F8690|nr:EpsG family protein [Flavobacterium sp. ALJ2]MBF7090643.1 EpsG family protein [Flavobacterium sp. ALJ2]
MITYIVLFFFFAALSFTDYIRTPVLYRKIYLFFGSITVFVILWMFAGLRWKTGTDWESYFDSFCYFSDDYAVNFEPGFVIFLATIRDLTSEYTVFLLILSFLCISLKFIFFLKYHKETFFTLVFLYLCYYFADIFAVRQNLAISLTLFSTWFIITKKPILFLLFVGLAASIHTSSLLYFFAYYIYWKKFTDKSFYYIIFFSIFLGLIGFGNIVLDLLLKALGLEGFVGEKISNYLSNDSEGLNTNSNLLVLYIMGIVKRLILIPLFLYVKNKSQGRFVYFQGYLNLYIVGNIIYFLFAKDLAIFARASVPFLIFEIFLISYVLLYYKPHKKKMIFAFVLITLFSWARFSALINSYYDLYVPYNSIFDKKIERNV